MVCLVAGDARWKRGVGGANSSRASLGEVHLPLFGGRDESILDSSRQLSRPFLFPCGIAQNWLALLFDEMNRVSS